MAKKFYVVWKGRDTGVFDNWEECEKQIYKFPKAEYKSFQTRQLAEDAYHSNSKDFVGKGFFERTLSVEETKVLGNPILESFCVDGAWNTANGLVEYQGVYTRTGEVIFAQGPFEDGTNNIVEFLAIVHALAYCKKEKLDFPIYSDSRNAINWVRDKEARTNHDRSDKNKKLFDMLDRAVKWLKENEYDNQILKWETKAWGENPADFGRK